MIEANIDLDGIAINGLTIREAVSIDVLFQVLGTPSRVDSGPTPAPAGHRNNQIHVYDTDGVYFNEHHFTRLAQGISFVLWPEGHDYRFTPTKPFSGKLVVAGYVVVPEMYENDFATNVALPWDISFAGMRFARKGEFSIGFTCVGKRQKSGRRSKHRRVVSVHASWPHDPWGGPRPVPPRSG